MAISSINFAKSSAGSFAHNDRTISPDYLIDDSRLNEVSCTADQAQAKLQELYAEAKENYQATYGQKFQTKFENTHWEAVVNLNANHTLKDLEELSRAIEKETGFTTLQISIHRDEGKITEDGRKEKNYHAHINFFTCDRETGRQLYRRTISNSERERIRKEHGLAKDEPIPKHLSAVMDKEKLSKLQDITALTLKMERGKKGSTAVRLDHRQYKIAAKEKEQHKEQIVDLTADNDRLRYNFREAQKRITALENLDAEQKKELHRLNSEINKIKGDNSAKVAELEAKLQEAQKPQHEPINASKIEGIPETIEGYDFRTVQQFISALPIDPAEKKDIHGLNNALKRSIKAGGGSEELKTISERLRVISERESAQKKKLNELAVKIKAIPAPPPAPYSFETIMPVIENRFEAIEAERAKERAKYEATIADERTEKEGYADMVAEVHHAYEHEPSTLQPILDRQAEELKTAKPAYKTALQRRDEAYRERIGRDPKPKYTGPKQVLK